ncbi:MAG: glycosyltransferase family 4 protein [Myxococcota bacterium]|nr:glycosyltransferase family 4 protein [Myxococcota bacterium]
MKLLLVARRYPPDVRSGTETVFQSLVEQAREHHAVRLVVGYRRDRSLVPEDAVAVDLRNLGRRQSWQALWWAAARESRRFKPDAVLANSIEVPALGAPAVCIVHDLNFGLDRRDVGTRARELFYRFKSRRLRAVITVSEASKQRLVEVGVPQERVQVIHNGVDLQRFQPPDSPSSSGPFRFAYPSRILPGKGQHLAIDAFARLPKALKQKAHLDIVGAAVDKVFLDQLKVQAHGLNVSFNVDVPKIAPFYQRADVVLFPTLMQEGFGFTAVEGMACGKPVIWTEQPAIREATGGIGLSFASGDVAAMRDHMVRLMSEPELARELGDQGRRYVSAHYDWAQVWRSYERVLAEVIQG